MSVPDTIAATGERIVRDLEGIGTLVFENYKAGEVVYPDPPPEQPVGMCQCGCGERTPLATRTRSDREERQIKGQPVRYLIGHAPTIKSKRPLFIVNALTGCWVWCRARNRKGYGITRKDGPGQFAHRMMWEKYCGPVPDGLELDHVCAHRACVNPAHLEVVTHQENVRRAWGLAA